MPNLGPEVKLKSDILDFKSDILFFFWQILASETFFDKKNQDITKKKKISCNITFSFFAQIAPILGGKKRAKTAKNGLQKKWRCHFECRGN